MFMEDRYNAARPDSCAPESYRGGNFLDDEKDMACSSSGNFQFLGIHDDFSLLENPKVGSGKSIDPRLVVLLEYFRKLYVRKGDLFKKTFPGIHDEFVDFIKRIGTALSPVMKSDGKMRGVRTLQRSLSIGSPRSRAIDVDESPLRLDRFKIRTVVLDGGGQGSSQDGGQPSDTKGTSK
ncbi:hypothetical protein Patl1_05937 [Pistacia atlantica]|uniref:Uncharacterized protein n=1 Tax=Pistacia atlantica TaxID=434234 RepID=A0ACC1BP19_9ROSI|nr:hypothetical protein Patl1_05937 [Pistacia atlantica]